MKLLQTQMLFYHYLKNKSLLILEIRKQHQILLQIISNYQKP